MLLRFFRPVLAGAHLPARLVACIGAAYEERLKRLDEAYKNINRPL